MPVIVQPKMTNNKSPTKKHAVNGKYFVIEGRGFTHSPQPHALLFRGHALLLTNHPPAVEEYLDRTLQERIMFLDGAMGTMIQKLKLSEEDFRGISTDWSAISSSRTTPPRRPLQGP